MNWLIKNFLRGLVIVVPIALTIYLLFQAFVTLDRLLEMRYPGLGVAVLLLATIAIGALASNFIGRRLFGIAETLFTKAPIVRIIYAAIKDLLEAFVGNKRRFDRPVAVMVGEHVKMFGFITQDDLGQLAAKEEVAVYVPFSYTWDGCLLIVSRDRVQPLPADSAGVLALVVSGGVSKA
ncbi:MAG TPA: DUF502 domain-containing protein [Thermoanaerobaculia bacterium]|nr:DUF502 domain-containing protein [Thermoanaerobaculia bacterium]